MRQTLLETAHEMAETRPVQAVIAGLAAITLAAGVEVVAIHDTPKFAHEAEAPVYDSFANNPHSMLNTHKKEFAALVQHQINIDTARASVSPNIYGIALVKHNGNVIAANAEVESRLLPPMSPAQAKVITGKMHYTFSPEQQLSVAEQNKDWESKTPDNVLKPLMHPEMILRKLATELSLGQETRLRKAIVEQAAQYVGVQEVGNSNSSPIIDRFTDGHPEQWCADFASYDYMEVGFPFSGGLSYGRPDWQLGRALAKPDDTVIALQRWFQIYGHQFTLAQRVPEPGDVVFQLSGNQGHAMILEKVLRGGRLQMISPNTGNAVRRVVYAPKDPRIVGFGSVFKK